ncbi:MAG: hypothetical protein AAFR51_11635 [Pseudomonadota bacterium]
MMCWGCNSTLIVTAARLAFALSIVCCLGLAAEAQRALTNTGFEDNDPRGPGNTTYQIFTDSQVPGWEDETDRIELWDTGFGGIVSHSGQVHAEMNANSPGTLYQDICMESGESFTWTFAHAARAGGPGHNPQVAVFEIVNPSTGALVQAMATQNSFIGAGWSVNTGGAVYTGPSGLQRFQFRSTNPGSYGNFLDSIVVSLAAYVEMAADDMGVESETSGPGMMVSGTVDTTTNVGFTVTGGSAISGVDYTVDAASLTVPAGIYRDVFFPLPITILEDAALELDETIEITIGAPSSAELTVASGQCGPSPKLSTVYTILDNDPDLAITKSVQAFNPSLTGTTDVYTIPGNDVIYTFDLENNGNGPMDADTLFLIDALPDEITFYNGDIDGAAGPETAAIAFSQSGTGLVFDPATNTAFSNSGTMPSNFADCTYVPASGYDMTVTHICIQPDGALEAGASARFQFRAAIR